MTTPAVSGSPPRVSIMSPSRRIKVLSRGSETVQKPMRGTEGFVCLKRIIRSVVNRKQSNAPSTGIAPTQANSAGSKLRVSASAAAQFNCSRELAALLRRRLWPERRGTGDEGGHAARECPSARCRRATSVACGENGRWIDYLGMMAADAQGATGSSYFKPLLKRSCRHVHG